MLSVLPLDDTCEDANVPDVVSYRFQSASASPSTLQDVPVETVMPVSLARIYFVLAQTKFGSNLLDANSDSVQLGRDLISGLRQGGLENVPYVCYLAVQDSLSFTVCNIVLAVKVSIDSY